VELGPKDVAKQAAVLARRDRPGREGKISVSLADVAAAVEKLLGEIHQAMYDKALAFRRSNTHATANYDEFKIAVETGFAFAGWCGAGGCEEKIKEETRATMRCIPVNQDDVLGSDGAAPTGKCVYCGQPAKERAIFARAY
jgi:prolyl-tRNA synthetase